MERKPISRYYAFGTCVRYLQDATTGRPIHGKGKVSGNLNRFFGYLEELNLQVTSRAADELRKLREALKETPAGTTLTQPDAQRLKAAISQLRTTLQAELAGFSAYVTTPKRIDVQRLLDNPDTLLRPGAFAALPEIARYDVTQAAKCIAFELPTAAAFHILRATEAVLRAFYQTLVRRGRVDLMWGPIIRDLRQRRAAKGHQVLIDNLDNIRNSFRNPTQHPERIYDIDEVQDLWGYAQM